MIRKFLSSVQAKIPLDIRCPRFPIPPIFIDEYNFTKELIESVSLCWIQFYVWQHYTLDAPNQQLTL